MPFVKAYTAAETKTFHFERVRMMPLSGLDPSMLIGFLCKDEDEWVDFRRRVRRCVAFSICLLMGGLICFFIACADAIFHGIVGKDERDKSSPSFFNINEATVVKKYCQDLIHNRSPRVREFFVRPACA
jgi:Peptidase family C54